MDVRNRCVAMVDILGFRERVRAGQLLALAKLVEHLVANTPHITMHWSMASYGPGTQLRSMRGREPMHRLLFSDTLLLWSEPMPVTPERQQARATGFLAGVARVICVGLLNCLPLRAGVAYGPVVINARKHIVIGQPIIDAYLTEGAQEWVGGAIHESYPRFIGNYEFTYSVPVKGETPWALARAIDWTMPARIADEETKTGSKSLPALERILQSAIATAHSERVRCKYANAAAFFAVVSEHWQRCRDV